MTDDMDRTPEQLRAAVRDYNNPPELSQVDLDSMWSSIEASAFDDSRGAGIGGRAAAARRRFSVSGLLPLAATLLLGIGIGHFGFPASDPSVNGAAARTQSDSVALDEPYQSTTSRYLGQAVALLASLPAELREGSANEPYMGRAHDLLLTTRLLLDSPAAGDPRLRTLLEDLELVLAQVVRMQSAQSTEELELIRQALEQRDVLPRLRSAVANISADD